MNRKHFEALAKSISWIQYKGARQQAAEAVADACGQFNARFNRNRFLLACKAKVENQPCNPSTK